MILCCHAHLGNETGLAVDVVTLNSIYQLRESHVQWLFVSCMSSLRTLASCDSSIPFEAHKILQREKVQKHCSL